MGFSLASILFLGTFVLYGVEGSALSGATKEAASVSKLQVVLKSDRGVYKDGDGISLQYIFQNKDTTALYVVPWRKGYTTNWLQIYEEATGIQIKTLPLVIYELKPDPENRKDFVLLKPNESHVINLTGVIRRDPLEIRQRVFHKGWWIDFQDSAFLLSGPGTYLAKAKYSSPEKWKTVGENKLGLRNVWTGDLESPSIQFRIEGS